MKTDPDKLPGHPFVEDSNCLPWTCVGYEFGSEICSRVAKRFLEQLRHLSADVVRLVAPRPVSLTGDNPGQGSPDKPNTLEGLIQSAGEWPSRVADYSVQRGRAKDGEYAPGCVLVLDAQRLTDPDLRAKTVDALLTVARESAVWTLVFVDESGQVFPRGTNQKDVTGMAAPFERLTRFAGVRLCVVSTSTHEAGSVPAAELVDFTSMALAGDLILPSGDAPRPLTRKPQVADVRLACLGGRWQSASLRSLAESLTPSTARELLGQTLDHSADTTRSEPPSAEQIERLILAGLEAAKPAQANHDRSTGSEANSRPAFDHLSGEFPVVDDIVMPLEQESDVENPRRALDAEIRLIAASVASSAVTGRAAEAGQEFVEIASAVEASSRQISEEPVGRGTPHIRSVPVILVQTGLIAGLLFLLQIWLTSVAPNAAHEAIVYSTWALMGIVGGIGLIQTGRAIDKRLVAADRRRQSESAQAVARRSSREARKAAGIHVADRLRDLAIKWKMLTTGLRSEARARMGRDRWCVLASTLPDEEGRIELFHSAVRPLIQLDSSPLNQRFRMELSEHLLSGLLDGTDAEAAMNELAVCVSRELTDLFRDRLSASRLLFDAASNVPDGTRPFYELDEPVILARGRLVERSLADGMLVERFWLVPRSLRTIAMGLEYSEQVLVSPLRDTLASLFVVDLYRAPESMERRNQRALPAPPQTFSPSGTS